MQPNTGLPVPQPARREDRFEERAPGPLVPQQAPAKRGMGAVAAVLFAILAQGKNLLILLKALPAGKLLLTSASMLAMVWFEAQRSGVWFAVGFVLCILVHELGHGYAMKRAGIQASWPVFIPFFGAMIAMKGQPQDRDTEARIAYGGPLAGTVAALVCVALGVVFESRIFFALAYTAFFLNLFNLIPFSPLDGGRVVQAFSRRAWIFGAVLLFGLFLVTRAPQLLLIVFMALGTLFGRRSGDPRPVLSRGKQWGWAGRYFALAAFLAVGIYATSVILHPHIHAEDDEGEGINALGWVLPGPA